jgi:hypothetical protein
MADRSLIKHIASIRALRLIAEVGTELPINCIAGEAAHPSSRSTGAIVCRDPIVLAAAAGLSRPKRPPDTQPPSANAIRSPP